MLKSEFEKLSGIVVSDFQYKIIEQEYMQTDQSKEFFAEFYKNNNNSLATRICRMVDNQVREISERAEELERRRTADRIELEEKIKKLTEQLEKELEWEPFIRASEVQQEDYEYGRGPSWMLATSEAVEKVCDEFGFDPAKVRILTTAPAYEKNRHGVIRVKEGETIDRAPYWCATDDNYIRFTCALWTYEMYNGELHQI